MNDFINNLIDTAMESGSRYRVLKPASQPVARYVGVDRNFGLASVERPAGAAKAPAETPAESAETENRVRLQKPGPAAPTGSVAPIAAPVGAAGLAGLNGPDGPDGENIALRFDMTSQDLLTGFIMSEVLGRPKCFSMRRRPAGR